MQSVGARQAPILNAQDAEFLPLSSSSRIVARPRVHARSAQSGSIGETRARVLNAMSHSAVFQASALRWSQLPGVSGAWTPNGRG